MLAKMENLEIKKFEDIQIGDETRECNCFELQGKVLAKGTFQELYEKFESTFGIAELEELFEGEDFMNLEVVAIEQDPTTTLEGYKNLIFFYDYDPSSVCVLTDKAELQLKIEKLEKNKGSNFKGVKKMIGELRNRIWELQVDCDNEEALIITHLELIIEEIKRKEI